MLFATMYCNIIFLMNYAVLPHHIIIYITLGCVIMDSREPQQDLTCSGSELVAGHVVRVAAHPAHNGDLSQDTLSGYLYNRRKRTEWQLPCVDYA